METLTVKIPPDLADVLDKAVQRTNLGKSELVRRALVAYTTKQGEGGFVSALDKAGDLVGCFSGGPRDLSSNPKHMQGFGKK